MHRRGSINELEKHCRVCAGRLQKAKKIGSRSTSKSRSTVFLCSSHKEHLKSAFGSRLTMTIQISTLHIICNSC